MQYFGVNFAYVAIFILCEHIELGFATSNFTGCYCPFKFMPISKRVLVAGFKMANCFFLRKLAYVFLGAILIPLPSRNRVYDTMMAICQC